MRRRPPHRAPAWLIVELAVCLSLLAILTLVTAETLARYRGAQEHYAWRQAAARAAEAQIERYASGAAYDSLPPAGLLPKEVALETHVEAAGAAWGGCDLVTVTARVERRHKQPIVEQVRAYLPRKVTP